MACNCEKCNKFMHGFLRMVMLKDELWLSIANKPDILCDACIVKKLKRPLTMDDFKLDDGDMIPCNIVWIENNKDNKKIFKQ